MVGFCTHLDFIPLFVPLDDLLQLGRYLANEPDGVQGVA